MKEAINFSINQFDKIIERLEKIIQQQKNNKIADPKQIILDNADLLQLFKISHRTAQNWRDQKIISYSQIGGKIYYRMSDIQKLLDENYKESL